MRVSVRADVVSSIDLAVDVVEREIKITVLTPITLPGSTASLFATVIQFSDALIIFPRDHLSAYRHRSCNFSRSLDSVSGSTAFAEAISFRANRMSRPAFTLIEPTTAFCSI
jgi:hypothetical protein